MDASAFIFLMIAITGIATLLRGNVPYPTVMISVLMAALGSAITLMVVVLRVALFGFPFACSCLEEELDEPDQILQPTQHPPLAPPTPPSPPQSPPTRPSSPRGSMGPMEIRATTHL